MVAELDGQVRVEVSAHESRHFISGAVFGCCGYCGGVRTQMRKLTEAIFGNCHALLVMTL